MSGSDSRWQRAKFRQQFHYLGAKQLAELEYWRDALARLRRWYAGEVAAIDGRPAPVDAAKVAGHGDTENAVHTWVQTIDGKYLRRLRLEADCFAGRRVLDVGCGPLPHVLAFTGAEAHGLDQLIDEYELLGFPLRHYADRLRYLRGTAERIPVVDAFFDAVISVNAIDHVDDFAQAAHEIHRVLRPGGLLRMEVHYHLPTPTEPWALDDAAIQRHFGDLRVRKIHEELVSGDAADGERRAVWSTSMPPQRPGVASASTSR